MRNKFTNVLWGLFLIAIGVGITGEVLNIWEFELFFDGWWTFLIIIPCFISMIQTGFGFGSTVGFIIGLLLFMPYVVDFNFSLWRLVLPAILIFIGIRIMFQGAFRKKVHIHYDSDIHVDQTSGSSSSGGNRPTYSAVFSGNRINVTDQFYGANLDAVFGGLTLDLRNAIIQNDVVINASAVFGGIDIFVPAGVKVKVNNVPVFGGVSDKSNPHVDPAAPTIYLDSTCMFGGIDIK